MTTPTPATSFDSPRPDATPLPCRFDKTTVGYVLALLLIISAVFSGVRSAGFIDLDDDLYITHNPHVLNGLTASDLHWAWAVDASGLWIPLTWLSLQTDATLSPPPTTPPGPPGTVPPLPPATLYHLHNLLLHAIAAALLFLLLCRATHQRFLAFAAALLWAIHPLRVESVAWVTERKDVLSGALGFLALLLYVIWNERRTPLRYGAVCLALALSLLAKPTFVVFPVLTLLLDFWPLRRPFSRATLLRLLLEKWAFFLLAIAAAAMAFYAQRSVHAVMTMGDVPLTPRLENALLSCVRYLWMQVHFDSLSVFYPYLGRPEIPVLAGAAILLLAITALAVWQRKERPWLLAGWLWYLIALLPIIGIVQVGEQAYADRFTYLPTVGLAIMVLYSIPRSWCEIPKAFRWLAAGIAGLAAILAAFTFLQVGYWQNSITLFSHGIDVTRSNYVLHTNIATAYMREGRPDLAFDNLTEAAKINPQHAAARLGLGTLYLMRHDLPHALPHLARAAELLPRESAPHNLYGAALAMSGQMAAATKEFAEAVRLNPNDAQARRNLEMALAAQGLAPPPASTPPPHP